jgi:hypothetical protein
MASRMNTIWGTGGGGEVLDRIMQAGDLWAQLDRQVLVRDERFACPVGLVLLHKVHERADARTAGGPMAYEHSCTGPPPKLPRFVVWAVGTGRQESKSSGLAGRRPAGRLQVSCGLAAARGGRCRPGTASAGFWRRPDSGVRAVVCRWCWPLCWRYNLKGGKTFGGLRTE